MSGGRRSARGNLDFHPAVKAYSISTAPSVIAGYPTSALATVGGLSIGKYRATSSQQRNPAITNGARCASPIWHGLRRSQTATRAPAAIGSKREKVMHQVAGWATLSATNASR